MKKLFDSWRKSLNEGMERACLPNAHSTGWIDPTGKFRSLGEQVADTHPEYAVSYFSREYGHATDEERKDWEIFNMETKGFSGPMAFMMNNLHWVRVANAYRYAGPKMENIPDQEWSSIVSGISKLVADCPPMETGKNYIYEYPGTGGVPEHIKEPTAKRFITALRRRGKIAPSRVAQFRETKEKENLQELQVMTEKDFKLL